MPASVLTSEEWREVEKAAVAGVSYPELARIWGIEENAIKQRAWRFEWATPERVERLKLQYHTKLGTDTLQENHVTSCNPAPKTAEIIAESLAEKGQKGANMVASGLLSVIERTFRENSPLMLKEIESHKEAASMFGMFAKASGLDKPQQAVQINMWGQASGTVSGPDIPLDCTQIDSDESQGP
jgi:hypothetical protein